MNTATFASFDPPRGWSATFAEPRAVHVAERLERVLPLLELAERAAQAGSWVALALAYEAAPAFDPAFAVHPPGDFPLLWVALFDGPAPEARVTPLAGAPPDAWVPGVGREAYGAAIDEIRRRIERGDTYQVNYTFPVRSAFQGDPAAWFRALGAAQGAGYCAHLDLGRYQVLSLSPELFFERSGDVLRTRPMKGTMPRGRWLEEDEAERDRLVASPKNRSENVMIVDLLRNDLGRIALPGEVRVTALCEPERYGSLWQLTSTVEARVREGVGLPEIMRALFPCGSITGAPKIRTMEIIRSLEPERRDLYTGTIGFLRPGGDAVFNVAIRTILLDTDRGVATLGVGGGITYDSTAESEYAECLLKAAFAHEPRPSFRLVETLRLEEGSYFLLERHLDRMQASAAYFGFEWRRDAVQAALDEARAGHPAGCWKVRVLAGPEGRTEIEATPLEPSSGRTWTVALAPEPIDSSDPFLFHKTTHRPVYARALAGRPDCDDLIFWNERGEITESSIANVVVELEDGLWTPRRAAGLLAGTFRDELLATGVIGERDLTRESLRAARSLFLVNSVRRWMRAELAG